ncbi:hypothetical protein M440DRAFT_324395 [Trichoderma longibrachiatum ATCC 18648]|uniref:Uncharacterized protein n=1 Tax=Trichoderma longibrachiatum ATCC 18648 TaxID=983965 RepID=A0A2T4C1S6_TRILO|nr:hypothetical protein M440DRAFT_324395 [Trichoderma longibrachiatum ATCC 18648]
MQDLSRLMVVSFFPLNTDDLYNDQKAKNTWFWVLTTTIAAVLCLTLRGSHIILPDSSHSSALKQIRVRFAAVVSPLLFAATSKSGSCIFPYSISFSLFSSGPCLYLLEFGHTRRGSCLIIVSFPAWRSQGHLGNLVSVVFCFWLSFFSCALVLVHDGPRDGVTQPLRFFSCVFISHGLSFLSRSSIRLPRLQTVVTEKTRRIDNDLSTLSFVYFRKWTERRPTGWFSSVQGALGYCLRAGGEWKGKKSRLIMILIVSIWVCRALRHCQCDCCYN